MEAEEMHGIRAVVFLAMSLACPLLFAQKVSFDFDRDIDFTPYKTYRWVDVSSGKAAVETTHQVIVNSVDVQLQARGERLVNDEDPDLFVTYQVVRDKKAQIESFNPDGQWNADALKPSPGKVGQGSLIVDLYDRKLKKLVWRGIVSGAFRSRQEVNYVVPNGISKLFANYPPR
jgi:hypothetical protein